MGEPRLNAVDMSRWGGELTATEAAALRDAGIKLVIVGTGNPNGAGQWARQQALAAIDAGMAVEAYIYLYFAGDPVNQVRDALSTLDGLPVRRWWLDAEDVESPQLTPGQRQAFLNTAVVAVMAANPPSVRVGIYTGAWWWKPNMPDSMAFGLLPLWNSWYDGDPDVDGLPYGGWTADDVAIEQYQGTTVLCGQSVDLNWIRDAEEGDVTKQEYEDLILALFAGAEERDETGKPAPRADRLAAARYRIDSRANGEDRSLLEIAASREAVVPEHRHDLAVELSQTGGVKR